MADLRIAVYAIALNEALHARRFVEACAGADAVVIADTGSRDDTVAIARDAGATVHRISIRPWRFDDARNVALALVPPEIDMCLAIDLDEVLSPGWADAVRRAWVPGTTRGTYLHVWTHEPDGSPGMTYIADRAHARFGYRWRHGCHEALYEDRIEDRRVRIEGMQVDHWPDSGKSRGQYTTLLEALRDEDPDSARNSFNLGREYAVYGRHAQGETELRRYLALPTAAWPEERASAMRLIAQCRAGAGDAPGELDWLKRACTEAPGRRESWVALARAQLARADWVEADLAIRTGLLIPAHPEATVDDPRCAGAHPYDIAAYAAWKLGRREEAVALAEQASALAPRDARLARNLEIMRRRSGISVPPA